MKGRPQGGDVGGTCPIDVTRGKALEVANASFDPGYEFGNSMEYADDADLVRGFTDTGVAVGEAPPPRMWRRRR